jgi:HPr kinase/phosphorylase
MPDTATTLAHASCVAIDGFGVLLRGPSGAGKSDLALRLIDDGARLVSDDQTELTLRGDQVIARAPMTLAGLLEVRGLGIVRLEPVAEIRVGLVVDLVPAASLDRMPEPALAGLLGRDLPLFRLDPFQPSAPAKLRLAVRVAAGSIMLAQ